MPWNPDFYVNHPRPHMMARTYWTQFTQGGKIPGLIPFIAGGISLFVALSWANTAQLSSGADARGVLPEQVKEPYKEGKRQWTHDIGREESRRDRVIYENRARFAARERNASA
eukprot:TRINITY_DN630_c0_g1_i2.p2 TRINITY_DN630_c0_g1~~TRINITY_DN630_c0_g1_i2.p2  ORF type:complete len:113 (-),score=28.61 TRINITY_DN630_c0_g1_i2:180-518(-)